MSAIEEQSLATASDDPSQLLSVFHDEIGKAALQAFQKLENNWNDLHHNLEAQFNDSQDEDEEDDDNNDDGEDQEEEEAKTTSSDHNNSKDDVYDNEEEMGAQDVEEMEQLIRTLNRHEEQKGSSNYSSSSGDNDEDFEDDERLKDGPFVTKVLNIVSTLKQRERERDQHPALDEWENDDDNGYVTISLSEQEFMEFEEVSVVLS
jgi:hypothetical protein